MSYKLVYTINGNEQINSYRDGETARRVYGDCKRKITYGAGRIQTAKLYEVSKDGEKLLASCER